ncbi:MAG TPA: hypothetical protein VGB43_08470 [Flavobacterium sp.]|jgi:hypothetical protein
MKNLHLCFITLPLLFLSCNSDVEMRAMEREVGTNLSINDSAEYRIELPANNDNSYDLAGKIHNEILSSYYANDSLPQTLAEISALVEKEAALNPSFGAFSGTTYLPINNGTIENILADTGSSINGVIAVSGLTPDARISLSNFYSALLPHIAANEPYEYLYYLITTYEDSIIANNVFTTRDKALILTTTSIARHSSYMRTKRPRKNTDPDWDWMTGNLISGTSGAGSGGGEAITAALKAGIMQNQ